MKKEGEGMEEGKVGGDEGRGDGNECGERGAGVGMGWGMGLGDMQHGYYTSTLHKHCK